MFGFNGQYLINLASAEDSWSDIQKAAAVSQARALQKYQNTHVWPLDQSTQYAGLTNTPTDQTVLVERNVNIANGQAYAAAKAMAIFNQVHIMGLDKFSTGYSGLTNTPTDQHVYMERNAQIAYAKASMDRNNLKILEARANMQPHYVGIDNTQTTDQNGRDRNVLIQEGIAKLEQENQDLALQLASLSTGYVGLGKSVTTYSNGGDRAAYIQQTLAESEARALAILVEMNIAQGGHYAGIDNTQTTDTNGRNRNEMIQQGIEAVSMKIAGCYDADHPRTCDITSGAKYAQYAP